MGYTNKTKKLELPQWVGTDRPTYLVDFNTAFLNIDNAFIAEDASIGKLTELFSTYRGKPQSNTVDLNSIVIDGHYSFAENSDYTKQNRPSSKEGMLYVYNDSRNTEYQMYMDVDGGLYCRGKNVNGTWSSWNRLVGESEYKEFINSVNSEIENIKSTANNANNTASSALNIANTKISASQFHFEEGFIDEAPTIEAGKTGVVKVIFRNTDWSLDTLISPTNYSGAPTGLALEGIGHVRDNQTGQHIMYFYFLNTTNNSIVVPMVNWYFGAVFLRHTEA